LRGVATAALDVSDGLVGDLGHVLDASGCGARLELARIPADAALGAVDRRDTRALRCLVAGGDDYELCFTAAPADADRVAAAARATGVPCTRIGAITAARGLVVVGTDGAPLADLPRAFDHFL